ncbi:MAG TPA: hypothetical protein VGO62_09310 [Myxococcota bacterium]
MLLFALVAASALGCAHRYHEDRTGTSGSLANDWATRAGDATAQHDAAPAPSTRPPHTESLADRQVKRDAAIEELYGEFGGHGADRVLFRDRCVRIARGDENALAPTGNTPLDEFFARVDVEERCRALEPPPATSPEAPSSSSPSTPEMDVPSPR